MSTDRIEKEIVLRAPRTRVWKALTDSAEFGQWFGVRFKEPFAPGKTLFGLVTIKNYENVRFEVAIDRIEPESLFSWRWHPFAVDQKMDYSQEPMTSVVFTLEEVPEGTHLKVVESGFDSIPEHRRAAAFRANDGGWATQMKQIEAYVLQPA